MPTSLVDLVLYIVTCDREVEEDNDEEDDEEEEEEEMRWRN